MTLTAKKRADEVRQMWQCRAMAEADAKLSRVILAAIACEWPGDVPNLLITTFGSIQPPDVFYKGYAFISPAGRVCCKMFDKRPAIALSGIVEVYPSENRLLYEVRKLADSLKLSDDDRLDMFRVLKKWITQDQRLDINNEKLAS